MPFIPLSNKGILGIMFIIISSLYSDLKGTMRTSIILIALESFSYFMDYSVDYENGIFMLIVGSFLYLTIAYILGSHAEKNRKVIHDLRTENEVRRNVETELKHKIALQNSLMNTIPTPLCFKDLNLDYVGINPAFTDLFGIEEKDIIGMKVFNIFETYVAETCNQMDVDLMSEQVKQVKEVTVATKDGILKPLIISKALIKDNEGNPIGIVGIATDITEQKEKEKLKNNIAELQEENILKTEFFSNISHELRTPLNVIFSAVQLAEVSVYDSNYSSNQNRIKKNIMSIKQNCLRLQRLVNNLIDISKIDAHAFEIRLQNLNIVYVIEEITLSVADYISNRGIHLIFDTSDEEIIMAFDEEKLERIVLNLLSNSIKHTPEGGTICVSIIGHGERVTIQIKDSGEGIPQDKLDVIFNRFYQITPINTRNHEGSGIGLNLVKSLVEMHEGDITVESVLGNGTIFNVNLPCKRLEQEAEQQQMIYDIHSHIENIQVEFSDIYKISRAAIFTAGPISVILLYFL